MPAGSESEGDRPLPELPRTWRPLGPAVMGGILVVALFAIGVATWIRFDEETQAAFTTFQRGTVIFVFVLVCLVVHALGRSRVVARREGLTVVNGYRRRDLEWAQLVRVQLPPGAPWATIDLDDGSTIAAMAIQASDGGRARAAVRDLRAYAAQRPD